MKPLGTLFITLLLAINLPLLASERQPNILVLIADDQAWGDHGFMGHPHVRTPNLDQVAAEGMLFTRGYVPTALCRPSLASLMTGLYPHQHRITGNRVGRPIAKKERPAAEQQLALQFSTEPRLAALLENVGYRSFQAGKWWEGNYSNGGFSAGMDRDSGADIGRKTLQPVLDFIDSDDERPFFVWYAPYMPHFPHNPPERLLSHYQQTKLHPEVANYYAMIEWTDETFGTLLAQLKRSGKAEDTVVVYLADNGWIQPTAAVEDYPWYFGAPRGKGSPYEGGVRTPVILSWPGIITADRIDMPVSSLDLVPTLLHLAGQPVPNRLPGINLLDEEARGRRPAVYGASFKHDINPNAPPGNALKNRWLVSGDWKLIHHKGKKGENARVELFDLADDPHEESDLANQETATAARLLALLDEWWAP